MTGRRIEDYGLIGDCRTGALVGRDGSIDWLCWPRFDSDACMTALLGGDECGRWRIAPEDGRACASRRYAGDTLILETLFETDDGCAALIDFMPADEEASHVVRIVEGRRGRVRMRSDLALRFQYGQLQPLIREAHDHEALALAGPHAVALRSTVPLDVARPDIGATFDVEEGERAAFVLTHYASHLKPPPAPGAEEALERTRRFWEEFRGKCSYEGPYSEAVLRSMITLKALTYAPTGGKVAALTASLPEWPGGERNWDYRYCWPRDAVFALLAFLHCGYREEAEAWHDWLLRAIAGEPAAVKPLYGIDGSRRNFEWTADWLPGLYGASPVRFGNHAEDQLQIDIFGSVMEAFHLSRKHGLEHDREAAWRLQTGLLDELERCWDQPDEGIWEIRADPQHHVHSKALAWVAFDRAVRAMEAGFEPCDAERLARWSKLRDRVRDEVLERGYDPERKTFLRAYDHDVLDASTLLLPIIGLIPPDDPRALGTVAAIERDLSWDGLVLRYDTQKVDDGLPAGEGAFLACSFWLADNYLLQGRRADAEALFERLLTLRNDLGLLSEEYDPERKMMLGNFPQAFSHLALVNTALNLGEQEGPAQDRLSF
ncbi:MAG: glycoside hydrolase family 15 protein [Allosphingosinicella sp.]|uniref:glycoside hydrolase family 15 protein n=1 Tax=Allosphingosinicella sp. TaxID=2823234 RepID=UPI0039351382